MYESVAELPEFVGTAWRAESGYTHDPGTTVADIIRFEREELGNEYPDVSDKLLQDLDRYSAFDAVWVNRRRKDCLTYLSEGESEEAVGRVPLPEGSKIITLDYCGGYLVLRGLAEPMLKKGGNSMPEFIPEVQAVIDKWRRTIFEGGEFIEPDARREIIRAGKYRLGVGETDRAVRAIKLGGGNPMPKTERERIRFHERIFGKGSVPPVERLRRGQTVNNLLPMEPEEGPPLPRGLGIKWPWNK